MAQCCLWADFIHIHSETPPRARRMLRTLSRTRIGCGKQVAAARQWHRVWLCCRFLSLPVCWVSFAHSTIPQRAKIRRWERQLPCRSAEPGD